VWRQAWEQAAAGLDGGVDADSSEAGCGLFPGLAPHGGIEGLMVGQPEHDHERSMASQACHAVPFPVAMLGP